MSQELTDSSKMTKQQLHKVHTKQLSNGQTNDDNVSELVNALGGIDHILKHYLSDKNDTNINTEQIDEIHKIITKKTYTERSIIPLKHLTSNINIIDNANNFKFYYHFNESNTYLLSLCKQSVVNIINILIKILHVFHLLTVVLYLTLFFIQQNAAIHTMNIFLCIVVWIPHDILMLLSSNKKAFKLVLKEFEFWFKESYAIFVGVLQIIFWYKLGVKYGLDSHTLNLQLVSNIFLYIGHVPLFIAWISGFDALNLNKKSKVSLSTLIAIVWGVFSLYFQIVVQREDDVIVYITETNSFSIIALISSSSRIICIFLLKQSFWTILQKDQCVLLTYTPYVKWSNDTVNNMIMDGSGYDKALKSKEMSVEPTDQVDKEV